jgi:TolB protein
MRIIVTILVLALAGLAHAQTDVRIRVTTEGHAKIKIGFANPKKELKGEHGAYRAQFERALRKDLDLSGYFEIVKEILIDDPHAIISLQTETTGDDLTFDVDLTDRISTQTIFRRRYGSTRDGIPKVAHIVADDIVYALTGRLGIANTRFAFVAGEKSKSHLYTVHIDGSGLAQLTGSANIVMSPAWSPEGTRLAFVSYEDGTSAVYVLDISNHSKTKFASFEGLNATPAWSPDGTKLAMTLSRDGNPEIYVLSLDGRQRKRVTFYSGIDCSPTWAPNGLELAFTSDRTGSPQVFVTDAEGLNVRRITYEGSYNTSPAWSPEGDLIAYVSRMNGRFQICTIDPFGVTTNILTEDGSNEDPSWSPDGMHIVFSSTAGGNSGIYIMNRDGSQKHRIIDGLNHPRNPAWALQPGRERVYEMEG